MIRQSHSQPKEYSNINKHKDLSHFMDVQETKRLSIHYASSRGTINKESNPQYN